MERTERRAFARHRVPDLDVDPPSCAAAARENAVVMFVVLLVLGVVVLGKGIGVVTPDAPELAYGGLMTEDRDTAPPGGGRFDADGDATRRTHLANERTYLAWWRTGLACMATSLGVGRLLPELTDGHTGLSIAAGIAFALLGVVVFVYGLRRYRAVDAAVRAGEYLRPDDRVVGILAAVGVVLALLVLAIIVV